VKLALEEALVNAIKHGHKHDPNKTACFHYQVTPECVITQVQDEGPGFDPEQVPDPLAEENIEKASGRGLFLMRAYMTSIAFNDRGNHVTLTKQKS
jgi:serine/threonine-protein kinase RsbW